MLTRGICIIGCGNISNTRHIPAILKNKKIANLIGIISEDQEKIMRTLNKYSFISNSLLIDDTKGIKEQLANCSWFMNDVCAVVIGTPPKNHFTMVKACLFLGKHVLVEKPMMMSVSECDEAIALAKQKLLVLNVMHSFQFAKGIMKLERIVRKGDLGKINSIVEIQFTNRTRRLPKWYNDLPLGLFYDEAAHFFYTAIRFGGDLNIKSAYIQKSETEGNTPCNLSVQAYAGNIPVQMYMNFDSTVCEWHLYLMGTKKMAVYDFFKDILLVVNNDQQHLALDVLRTSMEYSLGFWKGFIVNGFRMATHNLLYGHDEAIKTFINTINSDERSLFISAEIGKQVVEKMNQVVEIALNNSVETKDKLDTIQNTSTARVKNNE